MPPNTARTHEGIRAKAELDLVNRLVEPQLLLRVFKQINLIAARNQVRKPQSDQSKALPTVIQLLKKTASF